jgi:DNA-binding NarL/FixJ family response regulator
MAAVVIAVSDLMFQSRIAAAVEGLGMDAQLADTAEKIRSALASGPGIAVIDVHETAFNAITAIEELARTRTRVLAFGRHTAPAELRAARQAGAAIVVPRSELVERLPELLGQLAVEDSV